MCIYDYGIKQFFNSNNSELPIVQKTVEFVIREELMSTVDYYVDQYNLEYGSWHVDVYINRMEMNEHKESFISISHEGLEQENLESIVKEEIIEKANHYADEYDRHHEYDFLDIDINFYVNDNNLLDHDSFSISIDCFCLDEYGQSEDLLTIIL